jgi:hypothetical protein
LDLEKLCDECGGPVEPGPRVVVFDATTSDGVYERIFCSHECLMAALQAQRDYVDAGFGLRLAGHLVGNVASSDRQR